MLRYPQKVKRIDDDEQQKQLTSIVGDPVGELEGACVGDTTFSTQNEPSAQTTLVDVFTTSCRVALLYV